MIETPVLAKVFTDPNEANLCKVQLDLNDIEHYEENENTSTMNWLYTNAIGGIKIFIDEKDVEKAQKIFDRKEETDDVEYIEADELKTSEEAMSCPECGSTNFTFVRYNPLLIVLFWFTILPFLKKSNKYQCLECYHKWERK